MTAKEVCAYLGISRVTLHRRVASGDITPLPKPKAYKKRYRLFFRREDVEKLRNN